MNSIPTFVVSSTMADDDATWGDTTVLRGDVVAEIAALRVQPGGDLLVEGSARLVQTLTRQGLVDEYRLMVFPVILGAGERLFPEGMPKATTLTLTDAKDVGSGVLLLTYRMPHRVQRSRPRRRRER